MSTNIYDLANELERSIRALPEYQVVADAKAKIDANPEAKALFDEFVAFQEDLYQKMQSGQMPTEDDQKAIQSMTEKMEADTVVRDYFNAQQALSVYISDIERIVFKPLQELTEK
ncbi:YlbF/YmcA family competence regulator [Streptococcus halotolerans]|uniref:YlbF/YmcA family competence regulator n=1 Tax=Streptococcus halotolerans TaxID=1814128 RepID=UPI00078789AF|nr:YlbF/YmcA family competence regulator [Streptococcus halotolerans]